MILSKRSFNYQLKNLKCLEDKPNIAVGVSGGPDSMALVYLANEWIKLKKGKLLALVFDHGLRHNSRKETFNVKKMLKNFGIKAVIIKVKKNKIIKKNMAQARDNRFDGLIKYCKKNNILHLFLGHHFDDNLETYLIRKIAGSNLQGLGAMSQITYFKNIQIFRPFININKLSIYNFNKKNNLNYINDPSNIDINYTRVKIRNFLKDERYNKSVKYDFLNLRDQIPNYKIMIWELLVKCLIDLRSNRIKVNFKKLVSLDILVIEKIVSIFLKFLSNNKSQAKSSKINVFINLIKKPGFNFFNLSGVIIKKNSDFLIFSQK